MISLRLHQKQTKAEIKQTLEDWGKAFGNWFEGGKILTADWCAQKGHHKERRRRRHIFALIKKGELLADKLIERVESDTSKK